MGWRVVLAQRTPPMRAAAKRRSQAELGAERGRDAKFTERSWGGSQRSAAVQKTYARAADASRLALVGSIRRVTRSHWTEMLRGRGMLGPSFL